MFLDIASYKDKGHYQLKWENNAWMPVGLNFQEVTFLIQAETCVHFALFVCIAAAPSVQLNTAIQWWLSQLFLYRGL